MPDADLDADGDGLGNAEELANAYDPLDAADPGQVTEPHVTLFASLLPTSRSIRTDATATLFAMLLNPNGAFGIFSSPMIILLVI